VTPSTASAASSTAAAAEYNMASHAVAGKDFYKILKVAPTAGLAEIKASYRRLAMQLHPDRNKGDPHKTIQFKLVTEAYDVLSDHRQRGHYDSEAGHGHGHGGHAHGMRGNKRPGSTSPPRNPNYRKVYAPRPPPEWKRTWDHNKHYQMHYGDGFQRHAINEATKTAKKNGEFDYHSPLGKGFTFSKEKTAENRNPYSKRSPQGPKKVVFEYEESNVNMSSGKQTLKKRERVVQDLHNRRNGRQVYQAEKLRRQQQRDKATFATEDQDEQSCIIL
jgi:curved DNA-binding protein CbpA